MTLEIHVALLVVLAAIILISGLLIGRALVLRAHRSGDGGAGGTTASGAGPDSTGPDGAGSGPGQRTSSGEDGEPPRRDRAALVVNPTKAGADDARRLLLRLSREKGWEDPLVLETTVADPGEGQAREAVDQGATVVIAAGGDGTVRAVGGALVGTSVALGILPLGTGNLLARNLDVVLDRPEWALRTALSGQSALIDTGSLRVDPDGPARTFLVMAGIGFDAEVMGTVNEDLKDRVGWLAYAEAGSRKLLGHRVDVTVTTDDGEERQAKIRSIVAGNCGRLQGGVWLFPDAEIDDGLLDLLIVSPRNLAEWVGVLTSIIGKRVRRGLHTATLQGETFTIRASEGVEVQVDGDAYGTTDFLELAVEPASLYVMRPTPDIKRRIRREAFGLSTAGGPYLTI
ncbi:diacylglycerol/lipid kinase family protein [Brevibacterium yomogidense]|uniref:diacylglycerol/lipid kinase family protein n=1 Tax=Brevibacterium yomogidense TaxID=946573 RepID=UPI0018E04FAE|nr:diacylglycerol kinase family protein [Brevibacterium yomogidense]